MHTSAWQARNSWQIMLCTLMVGNKIRETAMFKDNIIWLRRDIYPFFGEVMEKRTLSSSFSSFGKNSGLQNVGYLGFTSTQSVEQAHNNPEGSVCKKIICLQSTLYNMKRNFLIHLYKRVQIK